MRRVNGYTSDVTFPAFFYKEMQPLWINHILRWQGLQAPAVDAQFSLCELGCGVGINLLVTAACHPQARLVGVDLNPQHLQQARALASAAGLSNIEFVQADFAEFARSHTEQFDFIQTHGVWSWIAPEHQQVLLEVVKQSLKPSGVFYLHYMCHPGSTELQSLQHLLNVFAPHVPGSSEHQVQMGLKLLQQLAERGMFVDKPHVLRHLEQLLRKNPAHLAHEFLTDHWHPEHGVDVHQKMAAAGLHYLCSADVFNNLDITLSVPRNLQSVVAQTKLPKLAETIKDMARNSHQRMDLFQRVPQLTTAQERWDGMQAMVFQLLPGAPQDGDITFTTPIGPIQGPPALCNALLAQLRQGPQSWSALMQMPVFAASPELLQQSLQLMMMQAWVHPRQTATLQASSAAQRLNAALQAQGLGALVVHAELGTASLQAMPYERLNG